MCAAPAPWLLLALALGTTLLAACSRTDPIEQARVAAGRAPTSTLPPVPGAGEPYPNLGSVPGRPETTSPAARQALANALVADRANARYVGQPAAPPVPRGQVAEAPAPLAAPLGTGSPMLMGAEQNDALPMEPPPPAPPPIAGAPRPEPAPPSAPPPAPAPAVLGIPQAPPPPAAAVPTAPPAASPPAARSTATGPAPPAGRVETAPIAPIAMEPLAPPPPPAMPDELPPRARAAEAAPPRPPPVSTDPPPVLLPAEPRAAAAPASARPAPPPMVAAAPAPAPPAPVQPSVVIDRTALAPASRAAAGGSGYALGFLPGTASIVPADRAVIASLAGRGRGATFQVTGFADEAGAGRALDLPLARARAVADALRAAGVPADQIELGGSARPGPAGRGAEVRLVYTR